MKLPEPPLWLSIVILGAAICTWVVVVLRLALGLQ